MIQQEGESFAKAFPPFRAPNLIHIQLDSFRWFQEEGLKELLQRYSIEDFSGTRLQLRLLSYEFRWHAVEVNNKEDELLNRILLENIMDDRGNIIGKIGALVTPEIARRISSLPPKKVKVVLSEEDCREGDMTYSAPLHVKAQLIVKETGEIKEQDIFLGNFPLTTSQGTFIINGTERVVVSQVTRSPGVYFILERDITSGNELCFAKLISNRGTWLEFETSNKGVILVKINGKYKIPVTTLLRALGYSTDEEILELFQDIDSLERSFIGTTMGQAPLVSNTREALLNIQERLHSGEVPSIDNARTLIHNLFFNPRYYDLGKVGRHKLNERLGLDLLFPIRHTLEKEDREEFNHLFPKRRTLERQDRERSSYLVNKYFQEPVLYREDFIGIVRHIIMVNNGMANPDDIDHLSNRRVRTVGELVQNQLRIGLLRFEQGVKERMSLMETKAATPNALINTRPITTAIREFFASSQLSQFMDQTNPLAELTHKRRLSALGQGGLTRERAGLEVRDIHYSHYGRICPVETPEGPNIGLITSLATLSSINPYGFIEAPYRRVLNEVGNNYEELIGRTLREAIRDEEGAIIAEAGEGITPEIAQRISLLPLRRIKVVPFASQEIIYLSADKEEDYFIAQADARLDPKGQFIDAKVGVRKGAKFFEVTPDKIDLLDLAPRQIVGISASLIPFLEHDDVNRALMGSNMERQAVPLLLAEPPIVSTGMERQVAQDSGQVLFASSPGEVISVAGEEIIIRYEGGEQVYPLKKFMRANQGTCISQRPLVSKGDKVKQGQILANSFATTEGELSLGRNVLCAFMSWEGYNFEDATIISESLVKEDKFTSIHIERYEVEARDTKLGPEEITRDIPNVGEESLRDLDELGIVHIGAQVEAGDILVGKITPKGETEPTAEERLLQAIFGEKARDVKDTSLRMPHGERGTVIRVKVLSKGNHSELPEGVNQLVRVWVAQKRKVAVGDKLAGRHGNKGVIARILPVEDMPFLADGTPVEIILNPIGVPSRMNLGQILETHLGWAAHVLGTRFQCPVFEGASNAHIEDTLARAWIIEKAEATNLNLSREEKVKRGKVWLSERGYDGDKVFGKECLGEATRVCLRLWLEDLGIITKVLSDKEVTEQVERVSKEERISPPIYGKMVLYDGRTGEPFDQPVTVGYIYMMKLIHLVEDKIHARSTGPYSLITQQPVGGKAQFGGQRFGEMEVWALEAYGAAYTLQEFLTIKSDDITGRAKAYEAIIKGEEIQPVGIPESFKVLEKELQSLALALEKLGKGDIESYYNTRLIGAKVKGEDSGE